MTDFNISDIVAIISVAMTTIGVISSMAISIFTLRQNSKMIEESSRPQIVVYKDTINIGSPKEYLVIKNFGHSLGTITKFNCDREILRSIFEDDAVNLDLSLNHLENITLANNQSYMLPIKTKNVESKILKITIEYKSSFKTYKDVVYLNLEQDYGITYYNKTVSNNDLKTISYTLQELIKRM
jgi:hypothetical protein